MDVLEENDNDVIVLEVFGLGACVSAIPGSQSF